MEYDVLISANAQDDIENIYNYIRYELIAKNSADKIIALIFESIKSLSLMPNRHAIVDIDCLNELKIHSFIVKNYKIYYFIDESRHIVTILRISSIKMNNNSCLTRLIKKRDGSNEQ